MVVSSLGGMDVTEKYGETRVCWSTVAAFKAAKLTGLHLAKLRKTLDTVKTKLYTVTWADVLFEV